VSGHPIPVIHEGNMFYEWTKMSYTKMHELRVRDMKEKDFWHLSGYLMAFRKEAMGEIPFAKGAVDAIMSIMLKEKGALVYAPDAIVYVKAPTNTKDFIAQKARVRAGYMNLPKMPRTAGSEIASFPSELFKINITRWPAFIFCGFVYAYSWIKAKFIKGKSLNEVWKVPESTK
jgi:cellulose synthase/poly-beta-1,6-N-acetylglucosamine synthase-like glycosyltransferase